MTLASFGTSQKSSVSVIVALFNSTVVWEVPHVVITVIMSMRQSKK